MMERMEWLAKHLLYEYDLFLHQIEERGKDTWRVDTNQGAFLLRRMYEHPVQLYFVASWLHYLYDRGIRSIIPFCVTKYGEPYVFVSGDRYALNLWIEEAEPIRSVPGWEARVLREVGRIHKVSQQAGERWRGYAPVSLEQVKRRWEDSINRMTVVAEAAGGAGRSMEFARTVRGSVEQISLFTDRAMRGLAEVAVKLEGKELARALCHGRLYRRNVIVGTSRKLYLTHFEHANFDVPIRDLAIFFRRYAPYYEWNIQKGQEWLAEYEAERPLTLEERQLLSCYLLFPERLMQLVWSHIRDSEEKREEHARRRTKTWQKHLRLLPKMHRFAFSVIQK